jgi:hypothetical protein
LDLNATFPLKFGNDLLCRLAKSRRSEERQRIGRTAAAAPTKHRQTQNQRCPKDD